MSKYPTVKQFTRWLGLCPQHQGSAGKIKSGRVRRGQNRAARALRLAELVQGIQGAVQAFASVLTVDDSADPVGRNVIFGATSLLGLAPAPISYNLTMDGMRVKGGTGSNVFTVTSTPIVNTILHTVLDTGTGSDKVRVLGDSTPLFIVADSGTDTITVGGGTLASINGFVSIQNTHGQDHLIVDDSKDPTFRQVSLSTGDIFFAAPLNVSIFYDNVSNLTIDGGTGSTTFNLLDTLGNIPVTINGGLSKSFNALNAANVANLWNITGINVGQVGKVTFKNIQVLGGGTVSDTFKFSDQAGVTGDVLDFGVGGIETLDYSAYTTPVTVNLKTFVALAGGIKTSIFNIKNVIGGQGNNIIVGDGNDNLLQGGKGRDILISGGGHSTLQAGSGEAILIGGHYLFDTDLNALNHLRAEWSRTDLGTSADPTGYQARVKHLESGGGLNDPFFLNNASVFVDAGQQTLTSGAGLDFILLDSSDILTKALRKGEQELVVV